LVYSIYDSTEEAIQKMIDASQRMITINSQGELGGMNPIIKRHYELQIKTLQNAPRDPDKLERLLKRKERQKEEAMYMEETQRLVTEIEMLKVVFCIWCVEIIEEVKLASLSMEEDSKKARKKVKCYTQKTNIVTIFFENEEE
jgi:hypothetical protein